MKPSEKIDHIVLKTVQKLCLVWAKRVALNRKIADLIKTVQWVT